jgi:hypothetical protein
MFKKYDNMERNSLSNLESKRNIIVINKRYFSIEHSEQFI